MRKLRTTLRIAMVFYKEWSLVEVCKKSKILENGVSGDWFWVLEGFGGGF